MTSTTRATALAVTGATLAVAPVRTSVADTQQRPFATPIPTTTHPGPDLRPPV